MAPTDRDFNQWVRDTVLKYRAGGGEKSGGGNTGGGSTLSRGTKWCFGW